MHELKMYECRSTLNALYWLDKQELAKMIE